MIATHNIKVNGRWVAAGEEYEPDVVPEEKPAEEKPAEVKAERKETPKEDPKPRTTRKRKTGE